MTRSRQNINGLIKAAFAPGYVPTYIVPWNPTAADYKKADQLANDANKKSMENYVDGLIIGSSFIPGGGAASTAVKTPGLFSKIKNGVGTVWKIATPGYGTSQVGKFAVKKGFPTLGNTLRTAGNTVQYTVNGVTNTILRGSALYGGIGAVNGYNRDSGASIKERPWSEAAFDTTMGAVHGIGRWTDKLGAPFKAGKKLLSRNGWIAGANAAATEAGVPAAVSYAKNNPGQIALAGYAAARRGWDATNGNVNVQQLVNKPMQTLKSVGYIKSDPRNKPYMHAAGTSAMRGDMPTFNADAKRLVFNVVDNTLKDAYNNSGVSGVLNTVVNAAKGSYLEALNNSQKQ